MKNKDEKERNETLVKIIQMLRSMGKSTKVRKLSDFLDEQKQNGAMNSEEDYQKEQAHWLESVRKRKEERGKMAKEDGDV